MAAIDIRHKLATVLVILRRRRRRRQKAKVKTKRKQQKQGNSKFPFDVSFWFSRLRVFIKPAEIVWSFTFLFRLLNTAAEDVPDTSFFFRSRLYLLYLLCFSLCPFYENLFSFCTALLPYMETDSPNMSLMKRLRNTFFFFCLSTK